MDELSPTFLLENPALATPAAPWCIVLDNLEMGILLLSQPWLAHEGLLRADLEKQLSRLAVDLPLGAVYFQRVKRSVDHLEKVGAVRGSGEGRSRRFVMTPQGFAALVLNLLVSDRDPTLDGSEFELKRAVVAMWNLVLERYVELPDEVPLPDEMTRFFDEVDGIEVLGQRAITNARVEEAMNILLLVARQREKVEGLLVAARRRLEEVEKDSGALSHIDLSRLSRDGFDDAAALIAGTPGAAEMVREMASGVLPTVSRRVRIARYEHYLDYLDELTSLYATELKTVDLDLIRDFFLRRRSE